MAFGFSDIGSMFSKGMGQYGQGLDKMRDLPMGNKMMAAGQILHGGVSPFDMGGAAMRLGQPPQTPGAPGTTPVMPPPAAPTPDPSAPAHDQNGSDLFMGLLPMLMKNGMGAGLLGLGGGAAAGGGSGGIGGALGGGLGGLLGKFGFGGG